MDQRLYRTIEHILCNLVWRVLFFTAPTLFSHLVFAQDLVSPPKPSPPATPVRIDRTQVVEAAPIDVFTERATGWRFESIDSDEEPTEVDSARETLGRIPGVTATRETPRLSVRGSSSLARALGLYDGLPLNTSGGFGPEELLVPNELVDSMQVIKGPASLFWGRDAIGGAFNFLPRHFESPTVRGHVGSFGQRGVFAATPIYGKKEESFAQLSAFQEKTDGDFPYYLPSSGTRGTRRNNDRYTQRYTLRAQQRAGAFSFAQNFLWAQEIGTYPGSADSSYPISSTFNKQGALGALSARWSASDTDTLFLRTHGIWVDGQFDHGTSNSISKRWANTLSYKKSLSTFAFEAFVDQSHDNLSANYLGNRILNDSNIESGAIFDIPYAGNWMIKPGFRYLWNYKTFIPGIGFFEETGGLSRWLTYSHGFRNPSLTEKFTQSAQLMGNPDLKPEISEQAELGFLQKGRFTPGRYWEKYEYGLSVFVVTYKDFISIDRTSTPSTYRNLSRANAQGFEAKGGFSEDLWGANLNFTYQKTEDQQKRPLELSPEIQTQLSLHHAWGPVIFEIKDTYWSRYFESGHEHSSWNTIDLLAQSREFQDYKFKVAVYNILDQPRELARGYPESQRRFWAMIERSF